MPTSTRREIACQTGLVAALLGLLVATYLYIHYSMGGPISCPISGGGCDTARSSSWASLAGVSTPLVGVIGYIVSLGIGLAALNGKSMARILWPMVATVGLAVSALLTGVEAWVIHAWCLWCILSATMMTIMWFASLVQLRPDPESTESSDENIDEDPDQVS